MATYRFHTLHAALAFACASQSLCFASDGADDPAAGAGASPPAPPAAAPAVSAPAKAKVKLVTATVRHGTVVVGDHGSETHVGPGGQVTLPEAEVAHLRARGVLHDPDSPPSFDAGPTVDNDLTEPKVIEQKPRPKAPPRKR